MTTMNIDGIKRCFVMPQNLGNHLKQFLSIGLEKMSLTF